MSEPLFTLADLELCDALVIEGARSDYHLQIDGLRERIQQWLTQQSYFSPHQGCAHPVGSGMCGLNSAHFHEPDGSITDLTLPIASDLDPGEG